MELHDRECPRLAVVPDREERVRAGRERAGGVLRVVERLQTRGDARDGVHGIDDGRPVHPQSNRLAHPRMCEVRVGLVEVPVLLHEAVLDVVHLVRIRLQRSKSSGWSRIRSVKLATLKRVDLRPARSDEREVDLRQRREVPVPVGVGSPLDDDALALRVRVHVERAVGDRVTVNDVPADDRLHADAVAPDLIEHRAGVRAHRVGRREVVIREDVPEHVLVVGERNGEVEDDLLRAGERVRRARNSRARASAVELATRLDVAVPGRRRHGVPIIHDHVVRERVVGVRDGTRRDDVPGVVRGPNRVRTNHDRQGRCRRDDRGRHVEVIGRVVVDDVVAADLRHDAGDGRPELRLVNVEGEEALDVLLHAEVQRGPGCARLRRAAHVGGGLLERRHGMTSARRSCRTRQRKHCNGRSYEEPNLSVHCSLRVVCAGSPGTAARADSGAQGASVRHVLGRSVGQFS